jgi:hypothetical protein
MLSVMYSLYSYLINRLEFSFSNWAPSIGVCREFFSGVRSKKSQHKAISVAAGQSRMVQPVGVDPDADDFEMWKCVS